MMNDNDFRLAAVAIFLAGAGISTYFRGKADRESGETISPRAEGLPIMIALRVFGLALWLGVFAYLINPSWMSWSQIGLPAWLRWLGAGLGALADLFAYWVFSNLGTNVSPTVATRKQHQLVTSGPYRWVRHPLYTMGMISYLSFALLAANWYVAILAVVTFIILLIRLPKEEAGLLERFGDEYRQYMDRTGRFLPKWG
jgi:protein-S-isoprenylcysteine O-methyltransferase Ste14